MAVNPASTLLALGCEDGCVHLLSLEAESLEHDRKLDRVKCRILSVAWGPPVAPAHLKQKLQKGHAEVSDEEEGEWSDSWLVTGNSDSSIRKWGPFDRAGNAENEHGQDKGRENACLGRSVHLRE